MAMTFDPSWANLGLQSPDDLYLSILPDYRNNARNYTSPLPPGHSTSPRPLLPRDSPLPFGYNNVPLPPRYGYSQRPAVPIDRTRPPFRYPSDWVEDFYEEPPIRGLPKDPPFPRSGSYPSPQPDPRRQPAYYSGQDGILRPDNIAPDKPAFNPNGPRPRDYIIGDRSAMVPYTPQQTAAKSAAAATKAAPRPGGFDLNSPRGILLQEGLGFGLGGAMSGGFALQAGATPSQALGIAGASVAGDAVGSGLGILAGMALGSFLGPPGTFIAGAVPFATRMIGGTIGSIAGDRWGWKATGAEDTVNRKFQEQQMQQQPMYDPETGQQYMAPPPPPTPEEKLRQQILSAGSNPYLPYMMTGGF